MGTERLNHGTGADPLWSQIADDLRQRVASGEFVRLLPPELELVDHYGVSRPTVRQAIGALVDDGLLSRRPGRGTEILAPRIEHSLPGSFSLAHAISAAGHAETSEVLFAGIVSADGAAAPVGPSMDEVFESLGLVPDADAVHVARLRFADGAPLSVDRSWLPVDVGRSLLDADLARGSIYDRLANAGHRPTAGSEHILPVLPAPEDRKLLQLRANTPALEITRVLHAGDRPIEYRTSVIRADRYRLTNRWGSSESSAAG